MHHRKLVFYAAAAFLGFLVVAADRIGGWDSDVSYGLAGFAAAALLGVGLPFAILGREGIKKIRRVEPEVTATIAPDLVGAVAAAQLHVVLGSRSRTTKHVNTRTHALTTSVQRSRTKSVNHDKLVGDGPTVVPTNGTKRVRAQPLEQVH
jgi:hypothetical protein